ncbi:IPT/TIG domain-containing protein [Flavitalea sp.]|nr:IPT/TIG domain-containing protein [Flavitalea sp.]
MLQNRHFWLCLIALSAGLSLFSQPVITSVSPQSGTIGSTVTLNGVNFSTVPAENIVYFGAVRASVTSSGSGTITVAVPAGAGYCPISITVNGLTAYSSSPFLVRYPGGALTEGAFTYAGTLDDVSNSETIDMASGDFDGDGKSDIATVDRINDELFIYKNISLGTKISFSLVARVTTGNQPVSLKTGDLDGDGRLDIVVSNKNSNSVSIFRNTGFPGTVSFASKLDLSTAQLPLDVAIADFDGDGKPDIATGNSTLLPASVSVLRNVSTIGALAFATKIEIPVIYGGTSIAAGDLNGDKKPDLVVVSLAANMMSVLINNSSVGSMAFLPAIDYTTPSGPVGIVLGDLDGDDKTDVAFANYFQNTISVFRNTSGGGSFSLVKGNEVYVNGAYELALNDVDGDGKPDLVVPTFDPSGFSVVRNNSTVSGIAFESPIGFPSSCGTNVLAGDWDNDGKTDVAIGCGVFRAGIWRNKSTEPQISSFSPTSAVTGQLVTITGANLTGATSVTFGGIAATGFTVHSSTKITATVGVAASGKIEVTTLDGVAVGYDFIYSSPPSITSFTPLTGGPGTVVTISGTNLATLRDVRFGGVSASSFTLIDATTVTAVVEQADSGEVAVFTNFGFAVLPGFVFIPPAVIKEFGPADAGTGDTISIYGDHLGGATEVTFGGVPATSFVVLSSTNIKAIVGNGASGEVAVHTPVGIATKQDFRYYPPPIINRFVPDSASEDDYVTIFGNNFGSAYAVSFGGVPAQFSRSNTTEITARVPKGASGNVVVQTNFGTGSKAGFTFLPLQTVDYFSPASGPIGTTITITGTHFNEVLGVYIGGEPAVSYTVLSPTMITATVDSGNSGSVMVKTRVGFAESVTDFKFIYPPLTLTSFFPMAATTGDTIQITGSNFFRVTGVIFGGVMQGYFTMNSTMSITVIVPRGASGDVVVTSWAGNDTLSGFTFLQRPPKITDYSGSGGEGQAISIIGEDFENVTSVSIGGVSVSSYLVNSSTSITAIVGKAATGPIKVTTQGGSATSLYNFYYDVPNITSFNPVSGPVGTEVTIIGSGFYNVWSISVGGIQVRAIRKITTDTIKVIMDPGNSGEIFIRTQAGSARFGKFILTAPTPFIKAVTPSLAATGSVIRIAGNKFSGTTAVKFGNASASSFIVQSDSLITAVVGSGQSGDVVVTAPTGTANFAGFLYSNGPVITSVNPMSAPVGATVTIVGHNFNPQVSGNTVHFGSLKATVLSATATSVTVSVPMGAAYEPISVTVNGLSCYTNNSFNVTFTSSGILGVNSFAPKIDSVVGVNPNYLSAGDADLDGKNDFAVSLTYPLSQVSLLKNRSHPASVSLWLEKTYSNVSAVGGAVFADLDGDGNVDMVVPEGYQVTGISVYRNTSKGGVLSFADKHVVASFSGSHVAVGDIDGDGKADLAVLNDGASIMNIYKNNSRPGMLSFSQVVTVSFPGYPVGIRINDFDLDNKPDIIIATNASVIVFRNTSTAAGISVFTDKYHSYMTAMGTQGLALADLDNDNRNDVIITNPAMNTVGYIMNVSEHGDIALATKVDMITGTGPYNVCIGDMDGNGKPDLIITNSYSSSASVFRNVSLNNAVSFAGRFEMPTGKTPRGIAIADVNVDGRPDIVTSNYGDGTLSILRNMVAGQFVWSFAPTSATQGATITIRGTGFIGTTDVRFGSVPAGSFTVINDSTISAIVSRGKTGSVSVIAGAGTAGLPGFTYLTTSPTITSFTPDHGPSGTSVIITGTNFSDATEVTFGGVYAASFIVNSPTSITAIVGVGESGVINVTTPEGSATGSIFTFETITGVSNVARDSKDLTISPNPARDMVLIKHPVTSKNVMVRFVDLSGRVVKEATALRNTKETWVHISDLKQGIYEVIWIDDTRMLSRTLMVVAN